MVYTPIQHFKFNHDHTFNEDITYNSNNNKKYKKKHQNEINMKLFNNYLFFVLFVDLLIDEMLLLFYSLYGCLFCSIKSLRENCLFALI